MLATVSRSLAVLSLGFAVSTALQAHVNPPPKEAEAAKEAPKDAHTPTDFNAPPPFELTDEARIAAGKARFGANCAAYCHGHEGSGGKTPAFRGRADMDPKAIFKVITEGRRGTDVMPAWGNGFSAEKRWELVAYIMYLSRQPPAN